jgi:CspA family cold shock protein
METTATVLSGTVTWFGGKDNVLSYGFISCPELREQGGSIFVHLSQIVGGGTLSEGERVTFTLAEGRKGKMQAKDVRRCEA